MYVLYYRNYPTVQLSYNRVSEKKNTEPMEFVKYTLQKSFEYNKI